MIEHLVNIRIESRSISAALNLDGEVDECDA
jgi:hypothetical protein